ncbi:MAG: RNA polymerase sigma factor [Verrucomicrobia bacterium]|nr:RNA polymerase sigma factor [Verrucomicrobiota bacterium]
MQPTDTDLTCLVQAWVAHRDEVAAREVMRTLHPLVAGIVRRHLPYLQEIEDVVQDVWRRVFEHLHRWRPISPLEAWVARIAVNACLKRLRTRRRKPTLLWSDLSPEQQQAALSLQDGSTRETATGDGRELLLALLDTLNAADRQIITLLHLEERTLDEAAMLIGTPKLILKVRAYRARARMKAALEKLEPDHS